MCCVGRLSRQPQADIDPTGNGKDQMVFAWGNAIANHDGKIVRADTLTAHFRKDAKCGNEVFRFEEFENVVIKTDKDTALSKNGIYALDKIGMGRRC